MANGILGLATALGGPLDREEVFSLLLRHVLCDEDPGGAVLTALVQLYLAICEREEREVKLTESDTHALGIWDREYMRVYDPKRVGEESETNPAWNGPGLPVGLLIHAARAEAARDRARVRAYQRHLEQEGKPSTTPP